MLGVLLCAADAGAYGFEWLLIPALSALFGVW